MANNGWDALAPDIRAWIEAPGIDPDRARLAEIDFAAGISRATEIDVDLVSESASDPDYAAVIGRPATLHVAWGESAGHAVHGLVARVVDAIDSRQGVYRHRLRLVPRLWRLSLRARLAVHADVSVPDAIRRTLTAAGFAEGLDFELRLRGDYPKRDFIIQYRESDLDFLRRLTEHWGISFFFEHDTGRDVVVFADANVFWNKGPVAHVVDFRDGGGLKEQIFDVKGETTLLPRRYVLRDYNYRYPRVGLQSVIEFADGFEGEIVEYGANFRDEAEAELLAAARRDEVLVHADVYRGKCALPLLAVGSLFALSGNPEWEGERYVVTALEGRFRQTTGMRGSVERNTFESAFTAVPSRIDYRPRRVTPKPRIDGVLHGIVEPQQGLAELARLAESGGAAAALADGYGQVDEEGCYRVRLLVDEPLESGGTPYPVVRLSQPSGGKGYGFHFPLRPGTEVMLSFVEGDPDRPIITGTAPNPSDRTPVAAQNRARNVIRTESGNQIDFDDTRDGGRIKLDTPFMETSLQLGQENGPEQGIWAQTNGSLQAVASTTSGVTSPFQSYWSLMAASYSTIVHNRAARPKGPLGKLEKAAAIVEGTVGVVSGAVGAVEGVTKQYQAWSEMMRGKTESLLVRYRTEISGTDAKSREASLEGRARDDVRAYFGHFADARKRQAHDLVVSEAASDLFLRPEEDRTPTERARMTALEAACADEPERSFLAFAMAYRRLCDAEDRYQATCAELCAAVREGDADGEATARRRIRALALADRLNEATDAARTFREQAAACVTTAKASSEASGSLSWLMEGGVLYRTGGNRVFGGHAGLVEAIRNGCEDAQERAAEERARMLKPPEEPGFLDKAGAFGTDAYGYYVRTEKSLSAVKKTWKTVTGLRDAYRRVSQLKKLWVAARYTGDLAVENFAYAFAWSTTLGREALGVPHPPDHPAARVFQPGGGYRAAHYRAGSSSAPMGLFKPSDALYRISSDDTTDISADARLFLHAPIAVLGGMTAPTWDTEAGDIDFSSAMSGTGTAVVAAAHVALVASGEVAEMRAGEAVLVTTRKVDIDGRDAVEITVGAAKAVGKPHRVVIDDKGILLDLPDGGKAVTVNAPEGTVTVNAKRLEMKVEEAFSLDAETVRINGSKRVLIAGAEAGVQGNEEVAVGLPFDKLRFTKKRVSLTTDLPVTVATPGLDVVKG